MFQKIWDEHVVFAEPGKQTILYIDLQLVHEVTSPQAFEGLRLTGRQVRRPERTVATPDHNIPTTDRDKPIADPTHALISSDLLPEGVIKLSGSRKKHVLIQPA